MVRGRTHLALALLVLGLQLADGLLQALQLLLGHVGGHALLVGLVAQLLPGAAVVGLLLRLRRVRVSQPGMER